MLKIAKKKLFKTIAIRERSGSWVFAAKKQSKGSVDGKFPRQDLEDGGFLLKVYRAIGYQDGVLPALT